MRYLLTICLLFSFFLVLSQDVSKELEVGEAYKLQVGYELEEIFHEDEKFLYCLFLDDSFSGGNRKSNIFKGYSPTVYLRKFNKDQEEQKVIVDDDFLPKGHRVEKIFTMNGKPHLFSSSKNKEGNTRTLYYSEINLNTLLLESNLKKIMSIPYIRKGRLLNYKFVFRSSSDDSHLLIYAGHPAKLDHDKREVSIVSIDTNANIKFDSLISLEYDNQIIEIVSTSISNDGKWSMLIETNKSSEDMKLKDLVTKFSARDVKLKLYSQNNEIGVFSKILKHEKNTPFKYVKLFYSRNEKLRLIGTYTSELGNFAEGLTIGEFDNSLELTSTTQYPFDEKLMLEGESIKHIKKLEKSFEKNKENDMSQFWIRNLFIDQNDNLTLVGSNYKVHQNERSSNSIPSQGNPFPRTGYAGTSILYETGDIYSFRINAKNELLWTKKINNYDLTGSIGAIDNYVKYNPFLINGNLVIYTNENRHNLNYDSNNKYRRLETDNMTANEITIDIDGKSNSSTLFQTNFGKGMKLQIKSLYYSKFENKIYFNVRNDFKTASLVSRSF